MKKGCPPPTWIAIGRRRRIIPPVGAGMPWARRVVVNLTTPPPSARRSSRSRPTSASGARVDRDTQAAYGNPSHGPVVAARLARARIAKREERGSGIADRRATPRGGFHRRPNADGVVEERDARRRTVPPVGAGRPWARRVCRTTSRGRLVVDLTTPPPSARRSSRSRPTSASAGDWTATRRPPTGDRVHSVRQCPCRSGW
jgi:hypothetical protein